MGNGVMRIYNVTIFMTDKLHNYFIISRRFQGYRVFHRLINF
jgi:hypothetical protein